MKDQRIVIFASGSGTNAQNIIEYFIENQFIVIDSLWSNNPNAFALERAKKFGVETFVFNKNEFRNTNIVVEELQKRKVNLIVLAGFLWLIPLNLIQNFRIIN